VHLDRQPSATRRRESDKYTGPCECLVERLSSVDRWHTCSVTSFAFVFAADERGALPLAVAIFSALGRLSPTIKPEVCLLDNGLSDLSRRRLIRAAKAARRDAAVRVAAVAAERLPDFTINPRISVATYARLLLSEFLPHDVRRAVYLDADVLVRGDLAYLFEVDLAGAPVGAVRDFLERPSRFFNAGVLAIDVERWRTDALGEKALERVARDGLDDQSALNAVTPGWLELDYRWNVQHGNLFFEGMHGLAERPPVTDFTDMLYRQRWDLYRNAAVLHFVGGVKPWGRLCPLPGTTAWVATFLRTRWNPPHRALICCARYAFSRSRYWVGTMRRRIA
jgi:lipopolysaccharide biosynthesis glycosyltransferase